MTVTADQIKKLREKCGAGIMECRKALEESMGDENKAMVWVKEKGVKIAEEKKERETKFGLIESYVHNGGKVVSVVEVLCETDFVAKNEEFKEFAHEVAMQVAAMNPKDTEALLKQEYIREPGKTIKNLLTDLIGKIKENIKINRFARYELGE